MTRVVGLSGGIGSGKSSVAEMLVELGATLIDSDRIVHELQAPGAELVGQIAESFGARFVDAAGNLDRMALGDLVFRDPEARQRLNRLVHPKVGAEIVRQVAAARERGDPLVVVDIPLLFENINARRGASSGLAFHATVLVWADEEAQIARQIERDGCDRAEALRRIRAQMDLTEKRELADFVVDNSGDLEKTRAQVRELYEKLAAGSVEGARC